MNLNNIKSSTQRECQRHFFIQSLYQELDKANSIANNRNAKIIQRANKLILEDKMPVDSCVDLLILEGYPSELSRQYAESISETKESSSDVTYKYDYSFEDHQGRIFTGRELDEVVEASSDKQAEEMVKKVLSSFNPPVSLIKITKI